ncbi:hypothetical protein BLA29_005927 [Euroglyphus maynei]|uniref:Uncharacterized protein n=1 Tax=Euroglyphus maynei TaxID=6958 RepID=A0A1Y3BCE8_EURMA|nr:hypothetical protein BLA29_005927 [Euroglyphus maynei]
METSGIGTDLDIEIELRRKREAGVDSSSLAREPSARGEPSSIGLPSDARVVDGSIIGREPSAQQPSGVIVAQPSSRDQSQLAPGLSATGREPSDVSSAATSSTQMEPGIEPYTVRGSSLLVPTQEGVYPPIRREFEPQVAYRPAADRFVEQLGQVASQVAATTRQPVTITFRPTIVIIQNFVSLPLDVLKARQQQGNEQIVNVQNQEVFVYPNSINIANLSATYSKNVESSEPFIHFIDPSSSSSTTDSSSSSSSQTDNRQQQSEKQLP